MIGAILFEDSPHLDVVRGGDLIGELEHFALHPEHLSAGRGIIVLDLNYRAFFKGLS